MQTVIGSTDLMRFTVTLTNGEFLNVLYSEVHVAVTQIHRIYVAHPRDNTNYDLHFPKNQLHLSAFQATMRVILTIYRNNRNVSTLGITLSESGDFVRSKVSSFFRFLCGFNLSVEMY